MNKNWRTCISINGKKIDKKNKMLFLIYIYNLMLDK